MSRRGFVGSSGTYNVRASEQAREKKSKLVRCIVFFLDDSQHTFEVEKRAKGQCLLELVCQHLELVERDYFALQFSDLAPPPNTMRWLDVNKSVRKQVKTGPPYLFYFRVKFYVSDPSKLHEEFTRYHFFLQLKKDILEGRLLVPPPSAILLASYAIQSEFGDFNPEDFPHSILSELHLVPGQTPEMEKKILELYKLHKGQSPADAEFNYLDHAKRLEMYGLDLHAARDSSNSEIKIGVASSGLVVFQSNIKINTFSWAKIITISFKRKHFYIQLRREGTEEYDSLVGFNLLSYRSCKNLWKSCVEHHAFFRLHSPRPQPRHRMLLFSLGSKFRYSGRTEFQTLEEGKRRARADKMFARSPSKRYSSRPLAPPQVGAPKANGAAPRDPHKIQVSEPDYPPKQAWTDDTPSSEMTAFVPSIPSKLLNYMDEELSAMNTGHEEGLAVIRMKADEQGRFGFNVKGGADQNLPILVSRVAPNTPADMCVPRLSEGDQVLVINGREVAGLPHDQVVKLIRAARDTIQGELVLTVRPNVYVAEEVEEPEFQYIPDVPHVSSQSHNAVAESLLLLAEALDSGAAVAQFDQLYRRKPSATMAQAKLPDNLSRNRYRDISPYDHSRVVLNSGSGDYINASHVDMEIPTSGIVNRYIATQGPLPNTCADFWMMVWEQQSALIVMVTTLLEKGRVKCHKYWPEPEGSWQDYGPLRVTCSQQEISCSFAFREFTLSHQTTGEERHVSHMQYLAWPDHGVPDDPSDFLRFISQVRENRAGMVEPTIVHCSAGIGRTGVLILMETAMCLIEANEPVYPLDIVRTMRDQRAMLIQTASQYKFVCEAILRVFNEKWVKPLKDYQR